MTEELWWQALLRNDKSYDGIFIYAVVSTGIFCRPSCASRPPNRKHVRFFRNAQEALLSGFRPCKRCRPDLETYEPERDTVLQAQALLTKFFMDPPALQTGLDQLGLSRRRLEVVFLQVQGHSLAKELDSLRLERAKLLLRQGTLPISQLAFEAGYGSLSGFYRHFRAAEGCTPAQYRKLLEE